MPNLSAGADDENDFCDIHSTPCYTELSFEHLTKLPANVPEREDRVLVVVLLSITFFVQVSEIVSMSLSLSLTLTSGSASITENYAYNRSVGVLKKNVL